MSREDTLYIGGLSFGANEDDLFNAFSKFGAISEVKVIKDRDNGEPRGFGFVQFENKVDAATAIEGASGVLDIKGKVINCSLARPRVQQGGYSRGGGGGGGFRQGGGGGFRQGGGGFGGQGGNSYVPQSFGGGGYQ